MFGTERHLVFQGALSVLQFFCNISPVESTNSELYFSADYQNGGMLVTLCGVFVDVLTTCFLKNNNLATRNIADETLIVPVVSHVAQLDAMFALNELGSVIWSCLDGKTNGLQIADAIAGEYSVDLEQARQDVQEFLTTLQTAGLIYPIS